MAMNIRGTLAKTHILTNRVMWVRGTPEVADVHGHEAAGHSTHDTHHQELGHEGARHSSGADAHGHEDAGHSSHDTHHHESGHEGARPFIFDEEAHANDPLGTGDTEGAVSHVLDGLEAVVDDLANGAEAPIGNVVGGILGAVGNVAGGTSDVGSKLAGGI